MEKKNNNELEQINAGFDLEDYATSSQTSKRTINGPDTGSLLDSGTTVN